MICCISGCSKRSGRDKDVLFYRIPAVITNRGRKIFDLSKKRREKYLSAIHRQDLVTAKSIDNARICSLHFVSGKPALLEDVTSQDWVPTKNLGYATRAADEEQAEGRHRRRLAREARAADQSEELEPDEEVAMPDEDPDEEAATRDVAVQTDPDEEAATRDVAVQTSATGEDIQFLAEQVHEFLLKNEELDAELKRNVAFSESQMSRDADALFYTGLVNVKMLHVVFRHVAAGMGKHSSQFKLAPFQEFVLTLVKLRTNCGLHDLASRTGTSTSTISRILAKWITALDERLQFLIHWPDRAELQKTMPKCFVQAFGKKVAVIIDCFEVFIERPSSLMARAQTYSSSKHHNTMKVLLGTTPQGVICYVSQPWGGRVSDKHLTAHSGFVQCLLPGDIVLADRGFDIAELLAIHQAQLFIPAFTKGKSQLSAEDVHKTRRIANVRIHVERVIGLVRQKYTILSGTLPITFLRSHKDDNIPLAARMVRVCCALSNLAESVVPFE